MTHIPTHTHAPTQPHIHVCISGHPNKTHALSANKLTLSTHFAPTGPHSSRRVAHIPSAFVASPPTIHPTGSARSLLLCVAKCANSRIVHSIRSFPRRQSDRNLKPPGGLRRSTSVLSLCLSLSHYLSMNPDVCIYE